MTIIVGLITDEGVYMGCDSLGSRELTAQSMTNAKIIEKDDLMIGFSGHPRANNLLKYSLDPPKRKVIQSIEEYIHKDLLESIKKCMISGNYAKLVNNKVDMESRFLISYQGRLFELETNFSIIEYKDSYVCIGSGFYHAQASLYTSEKTDLTPEERIKLAIECSNEFVMSTNNDITIKFQEYKKEQPK